MVLQAVQIIAPKLVVQWARQALIARFTDLGLQNYMQFRRQALHKVKAAISFNYINYAQNKTYWDMG